MKLQDYQITTLNKRVRHKATSVTRVLHPSMIPDVNALHCLGCFLEWKFRFECAYKMKIHDAVYIWMFLYDYF